MSAGKVNTENAAENAYEKNGAENRAKLRFNSCNLKLLFFYIDDAEEGAQTPPLPPPPILADSLPLLKNK